jgi:hypothetical protein
LVSHPDLSDHILRMRKVSLADLSPSDVEIPLLL